MVKKSLDFVLKRGKQAEAVVIVGAGKVGKELLGYLKNEDGICIAGIFDNSKVVIDSILDGIKIIGPCKIEGKQCVYIIAVVAEDSKRELRLQLQGMGIEKESIITYHSYRDCEYMSLVDEQYYQEELTDMYYERFGKMLNWENPVTYTEKINWEKLNLKDERRTRLADKVLVRDWVKEKIGEKYLTKWYGVWDDADDIDFDALPNAFVLKMNHASNRNIIVKDKMQINQEKIRKQLNEWKKHNHMYSSFEMHYKDIVPKIICEEYLEGVAAQVYDYNIFCFHGEPKYIQCIKGMKTPEVQAAFYNTNWEMQPFTLQYPQDFEPASKPNGLEEMLEISKVLAEDFKHVRVDLYNLPDGRILFGEMTFSAFGGLSKFEPEEYDTIWGKLI